MGAGGADGALARPTPLAIEGARKSNRNGVGVGELCDPDARGAGCDGTGGGVSGGRGPPAEGAGGAGLGAGDGARGPELAGLWLWLWAGSSFFTSWR